MNKMDAVNGESSERQRTSRQSTGEFQYSELPVALIATNVSECVFTDDKERVIGSCNVNCKQNKIVKKSAKIVGKECFPHTE